MKNNYVDTDCCTFTDFYGKPSHLDSAIVKYVENDIEVTKNLCNHIFGYFAQNRFTIKKVIFNKPATIVFWADGTKTVVKCADFDIFDPEKGLAMAICKRVYGERFHSVFKEFLPEEDVESAYPAGPKIPIPAWFNGLTKPFDELVKAADNVTISINTNTKEDK